MMYFFLILGLVTLIVGGEFLVRGAVGIAKKFQISTLVIGMTVISFGTSAPELFVSIGAALDGNAEIAIGNVIGSNVANLALVLGMTVLILPIIVDRNSKVIDWPMMMLATILFALFAMDSHIARYEGGILFAILVAFTFFLIRNSRRRNKQLAVEVAEDDDEISKVKDPIWKALGFTLIGLVALYFGSEWLVNGAVDIAESLGMEKRVIAVTVVAFGTSVPELVTSLVAAFKKETDISIGNLIGSNIFNIMAVVGITSIIQPMPVEDKAIHFDMWWVVIIAAALLPMMLIGKRIGRFKGALLVGSYIAYMIILVMNP